MSLYNKFKETGIYDLQKQLWVKNIFQVPKIEKVVVSMWIWSLATRKAVKDFSDLISNMEKITWQKPMIVTAKKSVSNFKLREGMPVMLKTTLRRKKAYDFIERLNKLVLPRVRDFDGLTPKKFDSLGNYNIWFKLQNVFPELSPDEIITPYWIQITIVTSTSDNEQAKALLQSLWLIFK